jgi:hypothetical protein
MRIHQLATSRLQPSFAAPLMTPRSTNEPGQNGRASQTVGTATLRMADVTEVVRLLSEQLRFEDQLLEAESAARRSKKLKAKPWVHCI